VRHEAVSVLEKPNLETAAAIARDVIEEFQEGVHDQVWLLYNEFKSVVQQRVVVEPLLPIQPLEHTGEDTHLEYLYDVPPDRILKNLLPRYIEAQILRALLEAAASEHGARMTAMDAATKNATEMIDNLTLFANKVRQAAITKELIEVVSGAVAH
jgi:F-type H+-transporting ATPase subunit gamma